MLLKSSAMLLYGLAAAGGPAAAVGDVGTSAGAAVAVVLAVVVAVVVVVGPQRAWLARKRPLPGTAPRFQKLAWGCGTHKDRRRKEGRGEGQADKRGQEGCGSATVRKRERERG